MWTLDRPAPSVAQAAEPSWNVSGASAPIIPDRPTSRAACRLCSSTSLLPYLDLGEQPLANALRDHDDTSEEFRAPLVIQACLHCTLSQLSVVVDPALLYSHYVYYSGVNPVWHKHCADLCDTLEPLHGKFVLEIASNDGTFLKECDRRGAAILGVEPASNFLACGYPLVSAFWSADVARRRVILGKVDYLVAQNVLGHVDDVHNFMEGIALALAPEGRAIIEVPYLLDLLRNNAFDTIYHEHLSYWTVMALQKLAAAHGLTVNGVARLPDIHGGSIRAFLSHDKLEGRSVRRMLSVEGECLVAGAYKEFAERVQDVIQRVDRQMPAFGYGAAAKATVLLNLLKHPPMVVYDDTPAKQGKRMPGIGVPIYSPTGAEFKALRELAILPWNWADELMRRAREHGFTGRFFAPLPEPRWRD